MEVSSQSQAITGKITVEVESNIVTSQDDFKIIGVTTGITPKILDNALIIYPNPTQSRANIFIKDRSKWKNGILYLYSITGTVVLEKKLGPHLNQEISIDLTHLPIGTYVLQIYQGNIIASQEIIKN